MEHGEAEKARAEGRSARAMEREQSSRALEGSEHQSSRAQQLAENKSDPPRAPERLSAVDRRLLWAVRQRI